MKAFELLAGSHQDQFGVNYSKGDIVKSNEDLTSIFKNKFVRVAQFEAGQVSSSPTEAGSTKVGPASKEKLPELSNEEMDAKASEEKAAAAPKAEPLGDDVTILFGTDAKGKPFTIHRNGELFDITKDGVRVNPDPLPKEMVVLWLKNNS